MLLADSTLFFPFSHESLPGIFPGRVYLANDSVPRIGDSGSLVSDKSRRLRFMGNKPYWAHTVLARVVAAGHASSVALGSSSTEPVFSPTSSSRFVVCVR